MSYSLFSETGLVANSDGMEFGHYEAGTGIFTLLSEDLSNYKGAIARFLNSVGHEVNGCEIKGESPPKGNIPPKPKMDPRYGDKTPALVRWYERYAPEEFKTRYKVTGRGTVPRYRWDPIKERNVIDRHEEVWLAERKTCMTEKVDLPKGANPAEYEYGEDA